jgi:asparagine synthase (glutamine-hydrolysing)
VPTLLDDMLVKVDRPSMAVSLETRLPLLDPDLAEFAWRLPTTMQVPGGVGTWALRRLLDRHAPQELVERPTIGFDPPLREWLRGSLRDREEDLLAARRREDEGFVGADVVRRAWAEHPPGRRDHDHPRGAALMSQGHPAASTPRRLRTAVASEPW